MNTPRPLGFLTLPPELRLRVYDQALKFQGVLHRPLRASAWTESEGHQLADISILFICKLVYHEAIAVLYELNRFRVSYNHICACENHFPYPPFDRERIRELEICSFLPRLDESETCAYCRDEGFGLLAELEYLPKLCVVKLAFEDIFSFADVGQPLLTRLSSQAKIKLASTEVGRVAIQGLPLSLELQSPALHRAWQILCAGQAGSAGERLPGELTMRRALEYLQFEANTWQRTSKGLIPFFVLSEESRGSRTLRFGGIENEAERRAEFTLALAGVLNDIFADDGGSESVEWEDIDHWGSATRWSFKEQAADSDAPKS